MADRSNPSELPTQADSLSPSRPLLSALSRWWSSAQKPASDAVLGYESAHPWTLGDDTPDDAGEPPY